jgi:ATP-dependent DNA helicase RecG
MGEFFGTRQSGLPPLRVAHIPDDMELLQLAQRDAQAIINDDPFLRSDQHKLLRKVLMQNYGEAMGLIDVG